MRSAYSALLVLTVFFALGVPGVAAAKYQSPGAPRGFVSDFAGVLLPETVTALEADLSAFQKSTSNEIAVVLVPNLSEDYIEHYAATLFAEWGIGSKSNDNGVLLVIALEDRELRIEVGYGLEGSLPDSVASRIVNDMVPYLKNKDYDGALALGVTAIKQATQGAYVGSDASESEEEGWLDFQSLFILGIVFLEWFAAVLARSKEFWAGGVIGGVIGAAVSFFLAFTLPLALAVIGGLFVVGLIFDLVVSRAYQDSKQKGISPPWWAGGGSWRGGGFGGFGGGLSGGGGASGRW